MKFRRKPTVVDAIKISEVLEGKNLPSWVEKSLASGRLRIKSANSRPESLEIFLLDGIQRASSTMWLVLDHQNHLFALPNGKFEQLYEKLGEE